MSPKEPSLRYTTTKAFNQAQLAISGFASLYVTTATDFGNQFRRTLRPNACIIGTRRRLLLSRTRKPIRLFLRRQACEFNDNLLVVLQSGLLVIGLIGLIRAFRLN